MKQMTEFPNTLVCGVFVSEIKNRFLCLVDVNGAEVVCYISSSCRLSNFLDITNRPVLLKPVRSKNAKTKYSVHAVKHGNDYILLNLSQANRIIESHIRNRRFSFLGKRQEISREATIDGYKSDLLIKDPNAIIEIKSILSFEKDTQFPTVYSERAVKQLSSISKLLDEGYRVCYMFVSLNPHVKSLRINTEIRDFAELFLCCIEKGMLCHGFSIRLERGEPKATPHKSCKTGGKVIK